MFLCHSDGKTNFCILTFFSFHIGSLFCKVDFQYRTKNTSERKRIEKEERKEECSNGRLSFGLKVKVYNEHCVIIEVMEALNDY